MNVAAIIPAAGTGQRMGGVRKAFLTIGAKPLLQHSVDVFQAHPAIEAVIVALGREDIVDAPQWLRENNIILVQGGAERADSVRAGLNALPDAIDSVLVHDAARPLVTAGLIDRVLAELSHGKCATLAIPVTDTLHEADDAHRIVATPDRHRFWRAQTPQAFPRAVLEEAFRRTGRSSATDEAGMVAAAGWNVTVVAGEPWNIKVTTRADIDFVESVFADRDS